MVPRTRRRTLAGIAALLAGLAGCNDTTRPRNAAARTLTDPPHVTLRSAAPEPPVSFRTPRTARTADARERRNRNTLRGFVASDADAAALSLADVEGADDARAFLDATDYGSETVFYQQRPVDECYRRVLCSVSWTLRSIDTEFADVLRPATASCRADGEDYQAVFVRIPTALDPSMVNRYSSGGSRGTGGCRERSGDRDARATTATSGTDADGATAGGTNAGVGREGQ